MEAFKERLKTNVIFVYTPMKVGSTSLVNSLRMSLSDEYSVLHIHDENCLRILTGVEMKVIDLIKYLSKDKKVYVMDLYRSPMERKISCYFEWITYHWNRKEEEIINIGIEKLINRFNDLLPHLGKEDYFKEKYELSSSEIPLEFPHEKKCLHIKKDNIEYIKLRLKDSKEWGNILSEIFSKVIITIKDEKNVKKVYEEFKEKYCIPLNHYEMLLKDDSLNYYYTSEDRNEYIKNWEGKVVAVKNSYTEEEFNLYNKISLENWKGKSIIKNHYKDEGCICKICSVKRKELLNRESSGEITSEKVIHEELVNKYIEVKSSQLKKVLNKKIKKVSKIMMKI